MSLGLLLTKPSDHAVERFVATQRDLDVTYTDVGAARDGTKPRGFHVDVFSVELGRGDAVFERAKDGLRQWAAHREAGVSVTPPDAQLVVGETVGLVVRTGGVYMRAACRVVWTIDESDRFGFGYGTLPGHPECGEEAFVVNRDDEGRITFDISAVSKPRHPLVRLGAPVARFMQMRATRNYLAGMHHWIRGGTAADK
jgi:uncharacterized protein (UPF0548 family)